VQTANRQAVLRAGFEKNRLANKPLERPGMSTPANIITTSAGRSAPSR
jgi:hypothetical protein